jgi:hypothetical protein
MQPEATVASNNSDIASVIEGAIRERTWDRVRRLRVEWTGRSVVVHRSTRTYDLKKLALEAVRTMLAGTCPVVIDITVT